MNRRLLILGLVLGSCTGTAWAQAPASVSTVSETRVIRYVPSIPSGEVREGSCWTESIAVTRSNAWRCMVGNAISDPCFAEPANQKELVCDANPALNKIGFVLKLTKPLPESSLQDQGAQPWLFRLADNSICEAMTGTLSPVNGEPARWACATHVANQVSPAGLVTALTLGKVWIADKFPESAIGQNGIEPKKVQVTTIWE
jgi:hypothetical protein